MPHQKVNFCSIFLEKCPVSSCVISSSRLDAQSSDLVLFKDHFTKPSFSRPTNQLWMMYFLECPLHTQNIRQKNMFNWTATYRSDSTLGKKNINSIIIFFILYYKYYWRISLFCNIWFQLLRMKDGNTITKTCGSFHSNKTLQPTRQKVLLGLSQTVVRETGD